MVHTALAFAENVTCNAAWANIKPVPDPTHHIEGDSLYVSGMNNIVALRAGGQNLRRARLDAPSLRALFRHYIKPVCAEDVGDMPLPIEWREASPLPLTTDEGLKAEVYSAVGSGTLYDYWIAMLVATGPLAPVTGPIHSVRFTGTGTITAMEWSLLNITLDETLPVGRYQIVGADVRSGSGIMFRFVTPGAPAIERPGGYTHWMYSATPAFQHQRMGNMGVWSEFEHKVPPEMEILELGTEAITDGVLDLIKIA